MQPVPIQQVLQKLQALSPQRIAEVEDFIDFLKQREDDDRVLTQAAQAVAEDRFHTIWDNPDDAEYDRL
jgi:hypothetical protein